VRKKKMQFLCEWLVICPVYYTTVRYLHNAECKACLEHSAWSVHVEAIRVARDSENAQVGVVGSSSSPIGAVLTSDPAECVYSADEGSHEE
jgi:hypothetical protein